MTRRFYHIILWSFIATLTTLLTACGDDPSMYRGEKLTFEIPISAKTTEKKKDELELDEEASSDFYFVRYGAAIPWAYPLFDYYREPIPVQVPVSPGFSLIDYIHPMYLDYYLNPYWDDDDGLYFRRDDD